MTSHDKIILTKGRCFVETEHSPLFCMTCQALIKELSKKMAARGDKNTGGKFS